jgi:hypothetical protein
MDPACEHLEMTYLWISAVNFIIEKVGKLTLYGANGALEGM